MFIITQGKTDWIRAHLVTKNEEEGEEKEFEMSAELISALLANESWTSLAVIQTVVLL